MAALPPLPREAVALDSTASSGSTTDGGSTAPRSRASSAPSVPSPRRGIPALFDQPALRRPESAPAPRRAGGIHRHLARRCPASMTSSTRRSSTSTRANATIGSDRDPGAALPGLDLREDILAHLGSRVVLYTVPTRINAPSNVLEGVAHAWPSPPSGGRDRGQGSEGDRQSPGNPSRGASTSHARLANPGLNLSLSVNTGSSGESKVRMWVMCSRRHRTHAAMGIGRRCCWPQDARLGMSPATALRARDLNDRPDPEACRRRPAGRGPRPTPEPIDLPQRLTSAQSILP